MIPKVLKIKGLYSYQKETEIDFSELSADGIFGIFGNVGSGKSSILEAISYVLYGEIERLNKRDSVMYNMMNLRSDSTFISFEFEHLDDVYRFEFQSKRNSKNREDVKAYQDGRKAFKFNQGQWETLASADAAKILGLSYEHFKRIVVIPQGKFQEFLMLSHADRTKMLAELFPLDQYDLGGKTKLLQDEIKAKLNEMKGGLSTLEELSPEIGKELFSVKKQLGEDLKEVILTKKAAAFLVEKGKESTNLQKDKLALEQTLQTKGIGLKSLEEKQPQFDQFSRVFNRINADFIRFGEIKKQQEELKKALVLKQKRGQERSQLLQEIADKRKSIFRLFSQEELPQLALDLGKLKEKLGLSKTIAALESRLTAEGKEIQKMHLATEGWKKEEKELLEQKELLEGKVSKSGELQKNLALLDSKALLEKSGLALVEKKKEQHERLEALKKHKEKALRRLQEEAGVSLKIATTVKELVAAIHELEAEGLKQVNQLDQELKGLNEQGVLHAFAHQLKDGESCPLCGSGEHPKKFNAADVNTAILSKMEALKTGQKKRDLCKETRMELQGLAESFRLALKDVNELEQALEENQKEIKEKIDKHPEFNFTVNPATIRSEIGGLKGLEEKLALIKGKLQTIAKNREGSSLENLLREQAVISERKIQNAHRFAALDSEIKGSKIQLDWEDGIAKGQAFISEYQEKEVQLSDQVKEIKTQVDQDLQSLKVMEDKVLFFVAGFSQVQKDEGLNALEELEQILKSGPSWENFKSELEAIKTSVQDIRERMRILIEKIGEKPCSEKDLAEAMVKFAKLEEKERDLNAKVGANQAKIEMFNRDMDKRTKLLKSLKKEEIRWETVSVFVKLFKGKGFTKFVSQFYLKQLCAMANKRFQGFTQNQLSLEIDEETNFVIRDFLNGGETRSIKTLSGGQTFQAALCLALGLSEQIQLSQGVKQGFFFMDEGFGSLDKESLSAVFESLKELRKENRTVGVISHVEDLKMEIDRYLEVRKTEKDGSIITMSC